METKWPNKETEMAYIHIVADCSLEHTMAGLDGEHIRMNMEELRTFADTPMTEWPGKFGTCYSIKRVFQDIGNLEAVDWDFVAGKLKGDETP